MMTNSSSKTCKTSNHYLSGLWQQLAYWSIWLSSFTLEMPQECLRIDLDSLLHKHHYTMQLLMWFQQLPVQYLDLSLTKLAEEPPSVSTSYIWNSLISIITCHFLFSYLIISFDLPLLLHYTFHLTNTCWITKLAYFGTSYLVGNWLLSLCCSSLGMHPIHSTTKSHWKCIWTLYICSKYWTHHLTSDRRCPVRSYYNNGWLLLVLDVLLCSLCHWIWYQCMALFWWH